MDVTVDNFSVHATKTTNNAECVAGAIAAYNNGTVKDCNVTGSMYVDIVMTLVMDNNGAKVQTDNFAFGGVIAVNDGNGAGVVDGCSVEGNITAYIVAYSTVLTFVNKVFNELCAGKLYMVQAKIINHIEGVSGEIEGIVGETVGTVTKVNA